MGRVRRERSNFVRDLASCVNTNARRSFPAREYAHVGRCLSQPRKAVSGSHVIHPAMSKGFSSRNLRSQIRGRNTRSSVDWWKRGTLPAGPGSPMYLAPVAGSRPPSRARTQARLGSCAARASSDAMFQGQPSGYEPSSGSLPLALDVLAPASSFLARDTARTELKLEAEKPVALGPQLFSTVLRNLLRIPSNCVGSYVPEAVQVRLWLKSAAPTTDGSTAARAVRHTRQTEMLSPRRY
jgi:hypothetical protein